MTRPHAGIKDWERLLLQVINRRRIAGDRLQPIVHHAWPSRLIADDGSVYIRPGDIGVGQPAEIFVYGVTGLLVVDARSVAIHRYDGSVISQGLDGSVETTAGGVNRIELSDLRAVTNYQVVSKFRGLSSVLSFEGGGSFAFSSDGEGNVRESIARNVKSKYFGDGNIRIVGPIVAGEPRLARPPKTPVERWRDLLPQVLGRLERDGRTLDPIVLTSVPPDNIGSDGKFQFDAAAIQPGGRPRILATELGVMAFDESGIAIHHYDGSIAFKGRDGVSRTTGLGARTVALHDLTAVAQYGITRMARTVSHAINFRGGGSFVLVMDDMKNVIESVERGVCTSHESDGVIRVYGRSFPNEWQGVGHG